MGRMVFTGGRVLDGSADVATTDIEIEDGRFVDIRPGLDGDEVVDLAGRAGDRIGAVYQDGRFVAGGLT